jgi:hypothetical protein
MAAACVAIVYTSLFAATYTAERNERSAERAYSDALTLIEVPAPDLAALNAERDAANEALAKAQTLAATSSLDPSSDEAALLLVTRAMDAGLTVAGITRIDPSQLKREAVIYDVQAIRLDVLGPVGRVNSFLANMHDADPGLIATLNALTVTPQGNAVRAEIVFSTYTEQVADTPTAGAAR